MCVRAGNSYAVSFIRRKIKRCLHGATRLRSFVQSDYRSRITATPAVTTIEFPSTRRNRGDDDDARLSRISPSNAGIIYFARSFRRRACALHAEETRPTISFVRMYLYAFGVVLGENDCREPISKRYMHERINKFVAQLPSNAIAHTYCAPYRRAIIADDAHSQSPVNNGVVLSHEYSRNTSDFSVQVVRGE